MKQQWFNIIFLICIICFTSCKKDGPSATLPEATQEGKNTFGMKVNGEVWTPYSKCGPFANPCGALGLKYNQPGAPSYYLSFHPSRTIDENLSYLNINVRSGLSITSIGNKYDSIHVTYTKGLVDYINYSNSKGEFNITKLDFVNEIISGTFAFTLHNGNDSIVITDGRFDCKFYTCICN